MSVQVDLYRHWDRQIEVFLIVDDDPLDRGQLRAAITRHRPDVQVVEFDTLAAAKTYLARAHADLIVLDNRLPDGLGSTLAVDLISRPGFETVPIFVVTGDDLVTLDHRLVALSKDDLSADTFSALLADYLRTRREKTRESAASLARRYLPNGRADAAAALSHAIRTLRVARAQCARSSPLATIGNLEAVEDILLALTDQNAQEQPA